MTHRAIVLVVVLLVAIAALFAVQQNADKVAIFAAITAASALCWWVYGALVKRTRVDFVTSPQA